MDSGDKRLSIITTKKIASNMLDVQDDFILDETPMSRLVFHAQLHTGGIRGRIIRQRRTSREDIWDPDEAIDIRSLGKSESINIELSTEAVNTLYSAIEKSLSLLKQNGIQHGINRYTVVNPDNVVITDQNKVEYINKIISAGYDEDIWKSLVDSNPPLVTKLSYARIQYERQRVINDLFERLKSGEYSETTGDDSWQKWIYRNNWLFGIQYKQAIQKTKINISGVMPDFLFPTLDGFVDILEIKLPRDEVLLKDNNHTGSWKWTAEANSAIGQVVNYMCEIDRLRLEIEREVRNKYGHEIILLKPRAYILIGDSTNWLSEKREGLRKLNHALHDIQILTYKDLLNRGQEALKLNTSIGC